MRKEAAANLVGKGELTVGGYIESLGVTGWDDPVARFDDHTRLFVWPPNLFGVMAAILIESGAYLQAARPFTGEALKTARASGWEWPGWIDQCESVAKQWREGKKWKLPRRVRVLLRKAWALRGVPLHRLSTPDAGAAIWMPFVELLCLADQAAKTFGVNLNPSDWEDHRAAMPQLVQVANVLLTGTLQTNPILTREALRRGLKRSAPIPFAPVTLGIGLDSTRVCVLPKMRTSQRGITVRSFSHHLCAIRGTDVEPIWTLVDYRDRDRHHFNVLLYPWPHEVCPSQFRPCDGGASFGGRPPVFGHADGPHQSHGFFRYEPSKLSRGFVKALSGLLRAARGELGEVHGLVMPEMSMSLADFKKLFRAIEREKRGLFGKLELIVCGVYDPPRGATDLGLNGVGILVRTESGKFLSLFQHKHHRWALDADQIAQYSLGGQLHPERIWWEGIDLPRRTLHFVALSPHCTFSALICEDLARPDPVADVIRSVGPNLVICLLQDGPQLSSRWSARYATVLADDPGSSVLTLSSLGMVMLSRALDKLHEPSRVVGLWRERGSPARELVLPAGYDALAVTLTCRKIEEQTIDGRPDGTNAGLITLTAVRPVRPTSPG